MIMEAELECYLYESVLFLLYLPVAGGCYFSLGDKVEDNIVLAMSSGPVKILVEVMLLLHLVAAFPIITNPPAQFFEGMLGISSGEFQEEKAFYIHNCVTDLNLRRCVFRSLSVLVLLFIAESVPSFGAILDLVGASTVTLLTFVFPPYFYIRLTDASSKNPEWSQRKLPLWERVYCWSLILLGMLGGLCSTVTAVLNILTSTMSGPCYLATDLNTTIVTSHH